MILRARLRLLIALVVLFALAPVQAAWAHAQLLSTNPAHNAVLEVAPAAIELQFNEPVSPLAITLIGPDGSIAELTEATVGGATLTVALPPDTAGTHVLSYRVVSTDGHPIAGSLVFSVGTITGAAPLLPQSDHLVTLALWAGKTILFTAMFIGIGGALFSALVSLPMQARQLCVTVSALGLLIAPLTLGLHGLDALGLPLTAALDPSAWRAGFSTSYGLTALLVSAAFAGALLSQVLPQSASAETIGMLAAFIAALALCLSGHASAAAPQWLTQPAVFIHILSIMFWTGALLPLWIYLAHPTDTADLALARFSSVIPFAVAPLIVSGIALGAAQLGLPGAHWLTPYGFILAAKLALLGALFALALWNRRWLTTPALAGDADARSRLRRSIGWELLVVLAIVGLVAGWRFTPPPRALAQAPLSVAAAPITAHFAGNGIVATVTISPGSTGPITLGIQLADPTGAPIKAEEVTAILSSPQHGIEPIKGAATNLGSVWQVTDLFVPLAGAWQLDLDIRVSRFALVKLQTQLAIP